MSLLLSHSSNPHYTSETVLTQVTNDFSTNVPNSVCQPSKHLTAQKQTLLTALLFPGFLILHCSGSPLTSQTTSSQYPLSASSFSVSPKADSSPGFHSRPPPRPQIFVPSHLPDTSPWMSHTLQNEIHCLPPQTCCPAISSTSVSTPKPDGADLSHL